eukprot:6183640-Pleurochrysis_carterae.AAC.1
MHRRSLRQLQPRTYLTNSRTVHKAVKASSRLGTPQQQTAAAGVPGRVSRSRVPYQPSPPTAKAERGAGAGPWRWLRGRGDAAQGTRSRRRSWNRCAAATGVTDERSTAGENN